MGLLRISLIISCYLLYLISSEKLFRSAKCNLVYSKAVEHITDSTQLAEFEEELKTIDDLYMNMKELENVKGKAEVGDRLINLLKKSGINIDPENTLRLKDPSETNPRAPSNTELPPEYENLKWEKEFEKLAKSIYESSLLPEIKIELFDKLTILQNRFTKATRRLEEFNDKHHENSIHIDDKVDSERTSLTTILRKVNKDIEVFGKELDTEFKNPFEHKEMRDIYSEMMKNNTFDEKGMQEAMAYLEKTDRKFKKYRDLESSRSFKKGVNPDDDGQLTDAERHKKKLVHHVRQKMGHIEL